MDTLLDRNPNQGDRCLTLESTSPQESTILTEKAGYPKRPLKPLLQYADTNHLAYLGLLRKF